MGRRHLQVVEQLRLEVVGVADAFERALVTAGEEHGLPESARFTEVDRLLAETRPEVVVVATHAPSHCEYVCRAAEAGARAILCEKPMGVSLAECDRMIATCQSHGTRLAVNHQMRFMEQYTRPKAIVDSEAFGGLASVSVVAGNFGMAMNGTHYFEMFRYMTGEEPAVVSAWFSQGKLANPRGPEFEDRAGSVRIETASGKRFYMEIGDDQGHGMQVVYAGPHGRITVDELGGTLHAAIRKPEHRDQPTTRYGMPWDDSHETITPADAVAPTRSVLEALLAGENYPTGEDGRLAVAALVAAYLSHEQGHRPVTLAEAEEHVDRVFPWA
jgi:predicted dehydrogenase